MSIFGAVVRRLCASFNIGGCDTGGFEPPHPFVLLGCQNRLSCDSGQIFYLVCVFLPDGLFYLNLDVVESGVSLLFLDPQSLGK